MQERIKTLSNALVSKKQQYGKKQNKSHGADFLLHGAQLVYLFDNEIPYYARDPTVHGLGGLMRINGYWTSPILG